jgi:hypothetical protein
MPDVQPRVDSAVNELLEAQKAYELVRAGIDSSLVRATERREDAIRDAAALGLSRRAIAQMTGLSHTRVIQILDGHSRRAETVRELEGLRGPELADKLLSLVYSNSMSREEMSEATGMTVPAVNEMIRKHAEMLAQRRYADALERVRHHMP